METNTTHKPDESILVVLTVDTEPDNAWENHLNPSVSNVRQLLRLQDLLLKYQAKATCLVTYRVVQDAEAVDVLKDLANTTAGEIGAHLHPWETPPFMESGRDTKYATYPHEVPLSIFEQKLGHLTEAISKHFGPPLCYRGGRWSIVPEHLPLLERFGYGTDSSVTPLIDWRLWMGLPKRQGGRGGPDYRFAPQHPYFPSYADIGREGTAKILEVPLSVTFSRPVSRFVRRHYGRLPSVVQRALRKSGLLRPVWALPSEEKKRHFLGMIASAVREELAVINIALHSSELMPTGSPKIRTDRDVEEVLVKIGSALDWLASDGGCTFATLSDVFNRLNARGLPASRSAAGPRGGE